MVLQVDTPEKPEKVEMPVSDWEEGISQQCKTEHNETHEALTPEEDKRLLRKIDLW